MTNGIVFDIRRYSIHDGPGIRTAVFFKGCPLACKWCHNPEGRASRPELIFRAQRCILCNDCLAVCPNQAISREKDTIKIERKQCSTSGKCTDVCTAEALEVIGHRMTVGQVLAEVERDRVFFDQSGGGVTFTGGEPLHQADFLLELCSACRARGISTAVDTCGHAPWEVVDQIRPLVDVFLYDLKVMDNDVHTEWTGVSNEDILSNLGKLSGTGHEIIVRMPVIPGVNTGMENVNAMGAFLGSLPRVPSVELLPYHNIAEGKYAGLGLGYELKSIVPPTREQIEEIASGLTSFGLEVKV